MSHETIFRAIGVVRTPFAEKVDAPRQATEAPDAEGTLELFAGHGYDDALFGLEEFSHAWVLFGFDRNEGVFHPKVLPPRSQIGKVGVFATRSPHRPNPIGMTVVSILGVSGLVVRVRGLDILDGSPLYDVKPYIAYADAVPTANDGWLSRDPGIRWDVRFSDEAQTELAWLAAHGVALETEITTRLALGPQPHAYRRIKVIGSDRSRLALKDWRVFFTSDAGARRITVTRIETGYRASQLESGEAPAVHREFGERFGGRG